ncbi:hypothetical protein OHR86_00100 [Streptomyces sp. NBC_00441]|uniref:hypothetical protein n=1 Tax=Streptomyces sp. NBC_00441 TaxID=2975742 RepID=UPI002E296B5A|nr:hypothetical protein [Streptomyces sp. NBC_00441]
MTKRRAGAPAQTKDQPRARDAAAGGRSGLDRGRYGRVPVLGAARALGGRPWLWGGRVPVRVLRVVRGVRRWLRPGRSMAAGLALLALSCLMSVVLAGVAAHAAPSPTPSPSASRGLLDNPFVPGPQGPVPGTSGSTSSPPVLPGPPNPLKPSPLVPDPSATDNGLSDLLDDAREKEEREKREAAEEEQRKEEKAQEEFEKKVDAYKKDRAAQGGVLSAFEVTDRDGNPVSSYRIYADTGDWKDWDLSIEAFLVDMLFLGIKWAVSFACFLISWSLSFFLAGLLLKPALQVSTSLYGSVVTQLGLPLLFLTVTLVVASFHLLFGNRVRGWGEMAAALVISALAIGALASPPQLLLSKDTGAVASVRNLAVETAALVLDKEPIDSTRPTTEAGWEKTPSGSSNSVGEQVRSAPSALARPITDALVDAFVARPAMLLSYGQTFDGKCGKEFRDSRIEQAVYDREVDQRKEKGKSFLKHIPGLGVALPDPVKDWLVDTTVDVTTDEVMNMIHGSGPVASFEKDCVKDAGTVKKASMDKVGGAAFMLLAAFLTCAFITVLGCGFLFAQVNIAIEAMIAKVALAAGILPGPGRAWLWERAAAIARSLALMLACVISLAVFVVVVNTVLNTPESDLPGGLTVRFIVLDGICVAAFLYRRKLARTTKGMVTRVRQRLGNSPLGGAATTPAGPGRKRGGVGKRLVLGGLALGAAVATGGTSTALGAAARIGGGRAAAGITTRLARAGGRTATGLANAAEQTVRAGARTAVRAGRVGLQATVGLPVYGPRVARRVGPAVSALPGQAAARVSGAVQQLHDRRQEMSTRVQPALELGREARHNVRSLGRIVRGRPGLGAYQPATPPAPQQAPPTVPAARRLPATATATPTAEPGAGPGAGPDRAPRPGGVRQRPAPRRTLQQPASAAHARLHQQLHRAQHNRATDPAPSPRAPRQPRTGRGRTGPGTSS